MDNTNRQDAIEQFDKLMLDDPKVSAENKKRVKEWIKRRREKITNFRYVTQSGILREASLHPTKGWKTHRLANLGSTIEQVTASLRKVGGRIYTEFSNPMVGV